MLYWNNHATLSLFEYVRHAACECMQARYLLGTLQRLAEGNPPLPSGSIPLQPDSPPRSLHTAEVGCWLLTHLSWHCMCCYYLLTRLGCRQGVLIAIVLVGST